MILEIRLRFGALMDGRLSTDRKILFLFLWLTLVGTELCLRLRVLLLSYLIWRVFLAVEILDSAVRP